jgi:hypothetical protein
MSHVEAGPWTDPIVEEVRAARDAIAARHGYDIDTIAAAFAARSKAAGRHTASPSLEYQAEATSRRDSENRNRGQ